MTVQKYQICTTCVMDTSDHDIGFDSKGVCNHCLDAEKYLPEFEFTNDQVNSNLERIKSEIKSSRNAQHDVVIGLSGGVDSSYVAYLAWKMNLKALCVHFDNGWNSEIAISNIEKIVKKTGFDLFTYVIDWAEFKDLQRSYFKAGVIDIEVLSDHAIMASMFRITKEFGIKYILSGTNFVTEHGMPISWAWNKQDLRNIKAIQKRFGRIKIKSFPTLSTFKYLFARQFGFSGKYIKILDQINYKKGEAMEELKSCFDWNYYGGKHYESTFTKFYQAYVLPTKFKVDKRRVHLSALIRNGEITRIDAVSELNKSLYDEKDFRKDLDFVTKKLGFSENEFLSLMQDQPNSHRLFKSDDSFILTLRRFRAFIIE